MSRGTSKLDGEKKKLEQAKLQEQIAYLLKEEENRYCADCDAKGPRWASWNLGIFLCIRCAGIHRNLGVHISKVKSVNLDSWTPENVQSMRVIGNSTARGVYEANLPEHFRRPQSDSSMESFIRAKYDQKRYIMKDWVKPKVEVSDLPCWDELQDIYKGGSGTKKGTAKRQAAQAAPQTTPTPARLSGPRDSGRKSATSPASSKSPAAAKATPPKPQSSSALGDLVSLDTPRAPSSSASNTASSASAVNDLLGLESSPASMPVLSPAGFGGVSNGSSGVSSNNGVTNSGPGPAQGSSLTASASGAESQELFGTTGEGESSGTDGVKSKLDIMALYGSQQQQQRQATTPTSNPQGPGGFGSFASAPVPNQGSSPMMMGAFQANPQQPPSGYFQSPTQFPGQQPQPGHPGGFQPTMGNQGFVPNSMGMALPPNAGPHPQMGGGGAPGGGFGGFGQFQGGGHPATSPHQYSTHQYPAGMGMAGMPNYGMTQSGMPPAGVNPYGMQGLPQQMGAMQIGQPQAAAQGNTFSTNLWQ